MTASSPSFPPLTLLFFFPLSRSLDTSSSNCHLGTRHSFRVHSFPSALPLPQAHLHLLHVRDHRHSPRTTRYPFLIHLSTDQDDTHYLPASGSHHSLHSLLQLLIPLLSITGPLVALSCSNPPIIDTRTPQTRLFAATNDADSNRPRPTHDVHSNRLDLHFHHQKRIAASDHICSNGH